MADFLDDGVHTALKSSIPCPNLLKPVEKRLGCDHASGHEFLELLQPSSQRTLSKSAPSTSSSQNNKPVSHWISTGDWPKNLGRADHSLPVVPSKRQILTDMPSPDRIEELQEHGIVWEKSQNIQKSSEQLIKKLLKGKKEPKFLPCYPADKAFAALQLASVQDEAKLRRAITPLIIPSVELLRLCGSDIKDYIGEELQEEWSKCALMGSTMPKPNNAIGFLKDAFNAEELLKLGNYCSPSHPFSFTSEISSPGLCFPFLVCKVKQDDSNLDQADFLNIHSASIATKAIIELHKAAFGQCAPEKINALSGRILVFSISHDGCEARLCGHFAEILDGKANCIRYRRYDIDLIGLSSMGGANMFKCYNFVLNIYAQYAPTLLKLIKQAVKCLPMPEQRTSPSSAGTDQQSAAMLIDEGLAAPVEPATPVDLADAKMQLEQMKKYLKAALKRQGESIGMMEQTTEDMEKVDGEADFRMRKKRAKR